MRFLKVSPDMPDMAPAIRIARLELAILVRRHHALQPAFQAGVGERSSSKLRYNVSQGFDAMATTMVHIRVDEKVKEDAAKTLAAMGMSVSDAVRMLLVRVAAEKALPFEVRVPNATLCRGPVCVGCGCHAACPRRSREGPAIRGEGSQRNHGEGDASGGSRRGQALQDYRSEERRVGK